MIQAHGLLANAVVVSDGAGQFRLADHALCWVHAERLDHKLTPHQSYPPQSGGPDPNPDLVVLQEPQSLLGPTPIPSAPGPCARFDRIFTRNTGYGLLDRLLRRLYQRKAELPRVLKRPEIPPHTNGLENDIRSWATKRKISGGTARA